MNEMMRFGRPRWLTEWENELDWPPCGHRRHGWADGMVAAPACDVLTRDGDLIVRVELPGVDPAGDVEVTVGDGMLCITGERHRDETTDGVTGYRRESWIGGFERGIRLPNGIDPNTITAHYTDGVLEIRVPHAADTNRRRVPIVTIAPTAPDDVTTPAA
jgi:HSP20 family protein